MRIPTIIAITALLSCGAAVAQNESALVPAKPAVIAPAGTANPAHATPKPAVAASTPEARSAAALSLSHEPTYDEGTAQRIKEAALSYSDLAGGGGRASIV